MTIKINKHIAGYEVVKPEEELDDVMRGMMKFFSESVAYYPEKFAVDERYVD